MLKAVLMGTILSVLLSNSCSEKCAVIRQLQGLALDPNRKMIPLKTQGAILY